MLRSEFLLVLMLSPAIAWAGAPAKIKRVPESTLNQVIVTDAAIRRIGIVTKPVVRKDVDRTITVAASVQPRPGTGAILVAPLSAIVMPPPGQTELLPPGTAVKAGQTVMRLRPFVTPGQDVTAQTRRDLEQAGAREITATKARARSAQLLKDGAGDQAGLEAAEEALKVAKAELSAAQTRWQRVKRSPLGADVSLAVRAPTSGIVTRLLSTDQQAVSAGQALVEIVNLEQLWVRAEVYVGHVSQVDRARPAGLRPLGDGPAMLAQPTVAPLTARGGGTVLELWYAPDNPALLVPGARLKADLPLKDSALPALTVPWSAIIYDAQGAAWVYIQVDQNTYERRRVDVRAVVGDDAVLDRGPPVQSKVVVQGASELFGTEFGIGK